MIFKFVKLYFIQKKSLYIVGEKYSVGLKVLNFDDNSIFEIK